MSGLFVKLITNCLTFQIKRFCEVSATAKSVNLEAPNIYDKVELIRISMLKFGIEMPTTIALTSVIIVLVISVSVVSWAEAGGDDDEGGWRNKW